MSVEQELLERVDEQACIDFLAQMIRHKSYSETEGERELAEFMRRAMSDIGLESSLQPVSGRRVNAIGRLAGRGGGQSLLFNGHLDTNPVTGGWTVDPWGGIVDGDCIYGIGRIEHEVVATRPTSAPCARCSNRDCGPRAT